MRRAALASVVVALALAAGCWPPSVREGLVCGTDDACPPRQKCQEGVCLLPGSPLPSRDAGPPDGPAPDPDTTDAGPVDVPVDTPGEGGQDGATDGGADAGDLTDQGPGGDAPVVVTSDNFDDGARGLQWQLQVDGSTRISETGGQLQLQVNTTTATYAGYVSTSRYDLRGTTLTVELGDQGTGDLTVEMTVSPDPINSPDGIGFGLISGQYVCFDYEQGQGHAPCTVDPAGAHSAWVRMKFGQDSVEWDFSFDGQSWTPQGSATTSLALDAMYVTLLGGANVDGITQGTVSFDNFSITRP
jgi:hypothetical protein